SAAMSLLAAHFEDYSKQLAAEWLDVREDILWYEEYCDENNLWPDEGEIYSSKIDPYFTALSEEDEDSYTKDFGRFTRVNTYYYVLKDIKYSGEWGDTLFDFFRPKDEDANYSEDFALFAPLAASLSDGQRAALEFINLSTLIKLGMGSDSVTAVDFPSVDTLFKDKDGNTVESISIYSGINRAIFRRGVALTNDTMMQKAMGNDPYENIWDMGGVVDIISYTTFAVGAVTMIAGVGMAIRGAQATAASASAAAAAAAKAAEQIPRLTENLQRSIRALNETIDRVVSDNAESSNAVRIQMSMKQVNDAGMLLDNAKTAANNTTGTISKLSTAGKWMMGIGGALMIVAAALKAVQLYQYYHRTFTQIPVMIVDEADIVSYTTNSEGKKVKNITFDQFVYYEVVKCNRQQVGINPSAQTGVSDYESWGCGDAADINGDVGKQWLAIYANRSTKKGNPILADSFVLRTGKEEIAKGGKATDAANMPSGCNGCLHMFSSESPLRIDNEKFCYRSDNNGMFLYWKGDEKAFADASQTASAFGSGGYMALTGVGGLALGIVGTALFTGRKKKEQNEEPAA
ncbi:MAG: hypothetical protein IKX49_04260, partial [Clostridia bacterium]|nr:hypothetical protein [Clostridia bacterium]